MSHFDFQDGLFISVLIIKIQDVHDVHCFVFLSNCLILFVLLVTRLRLLPTVFWYMSSLITKVHLLPFVCKSHEG